jgi:hypothetical protein
MYPYHVSALGLLFDIAGAFFLAAEAIKLENLRALRDRVLRRLRHATISPPFAPSRGKPLTPEMQQYLREAREFGPPWALKHHYLFTLLHYLAGIVVLFAANWLAGGRLIGWLWAGAAWAIASMPAILAYGAILVVVVWLIGAGLWMLGELVHVTITWSIRRSITAIEFIERHTSDGGVGMFGFSLLFIGFLLQLIGTIASGY